MRLTRSQVVESNLLLNKVHQSRILTVLFSALLSVLTINPTCLLAKGYITSYFSLQGNRVLGEGVSGNQFDGATGFRFESGLVRTTGVGFVFWGTSVNWANNRVADSKVRVRFYEPYYFEYRRYYSMTNSHLFWGGGLGWIRMHVSGSNEADNQYRLALTYGAVFGKGEGNHLQIIVRPYLLMSNCLEQSSGIELLFGFCGMTESKPRK